MLFRGVHDVLTGAFTSLYQDAVYVQHVTLDDDNAANDFKDPVRAPQDHPCKVQIDTSSRGQRSDGGVRIRGSRAKILTESLAERFSVKSCGYIGGMALHSIRNDYEMRKTKTMTAHLASMEKKEY